jgi:nitrogen fixation protein FixH
VAILAWPAVETYKFFVARQQLAASQQLERTVTERLAQTRAKGAQVAKTDLAAPAQKP